MAKKKKDITEKFVTVKINAPKIQVVEPPHYDESTISLPLRGWISIQVPVELDGVTLQIAPTDELMNVIMPIVEDQIRRVIGRIVVVEEDNG